MPRYSSNAEQAEQQRPSRHWSRPVVDGSCTVTHVEDMELIANVIDVIRSQHKTAPPDRMNGENVVEDPSDLLEDT